MMTLYPLQRENGFNPNDPFEDTESLAISSPTSLRSAVSTPTIRSRILKDSHHILRHKAVEKVSTPTIRSRILKDVGRRGADVQGKEFQPQRSVRGY